MKTTDKLMQDLDKLIAENPEHTIVTAMKFEELYRGEPGNAGYRRVYWRLFAQVEKQFPVTTPTEIDPPDEAWDDEAHPFWTSDPYAVWDHRYRELKDELGWVATRIAVSELQARGQDLATSNAS